MSSEQLVPNSYVGMPAHMKLEAFGDEIWSAFGQPAYLVGSATRSKHWRDVDVRLILSDGEWIALGLSDWRRPSQCRKWRALCLAFSALGRDMTGLPIDFQIIHQQKSTDFYSGETRVCIGLVPWRFAKPELTGPEYEI